MVKLSGIPYNRPYGALAEWLGKGLQNPVHRFDSGTRLHVEIMLQFLQVFNLLQFTHNFSFRLANSHRLGLLAVFLIQQVAAWFAAGLCGRVVERYTRRT